MNEQLWLPSWLATISISLSIAILWSVRRAEKHKLPVSQVLDLGLIMMIAAFIGGRLFHVLFEQPHFYLENPWFILQFWQGGFVYFGGILSALLAGYFKCRKNKWPWLQFANFFAPLFAFTYAAGRIGCFLNGCCYGKICTLPWAMTFHQHAPYGIDLVPRHPTQAYAILGESLILFLLLFIERPRANPTWWIRFAKHNLFFVWLGLHAINRLIMEHFRDDFRGTHILGLSLGQWLSCGLLISSTGVLLRSIVTRRVAT